MPQDRAEVPQASQVTEPLTDEPQRPDDGGQFDDATLEAIIHESVDRVITDPVMRRDLLWMFRQLDRAHATIAAQSKLLAERDKEIAVLLQSNSYRRNESLTAELAQARGRVRGVVAKMTETLAFPQQIGAQGVAGADIRTWRDQLASLLASTKERT